MSDLVRGTARAPAPPAPAEPAQGDVEQPAAKPPRGVSPVRLAKTGASDLAAPPPAPPAAPATPPPASRPAAPAPPSPLPRPPEPAARTPVPTVESQAEAERLHSELREFLELLRDRVKIGTPPSWADLERLITSALDSLERANELFWVANRATVPAGVDYLAFHQACVAVLALRVGLTVGLGRPQLIELGMAGCLIDIGLWELPAGVLNRLDTLTDAERGQYRAHPRTAAEAIRGWSPPSPALAELVLQHHEREQGQGFPQGLSGEIIHPQAKILGLVDTYTGLIVPPVFRPGLRPHEAIREIVRTKHESFPPVLIKALLNEISVFPPGTLVRLNTSEVGVVIGVNRNHPLRPRLEVVDAQGQRLPTPKLIDLSEAPFLYITGPVTEGAR